MLDRPEEPELGGAPAYLDIVGVNYYRDNQWRRGRPDDPARPSRIRAPLARSWPTSHARYGGRSCSPRPAPRAARGRLAALRRPGGSRRAGGRRAGRGDLPLPDSRISGLGERAATATPACSAIRTGRGAGLCTSRWRGAGRQQAVARAGCWAELASRPAGNGRIDPARQRHRPPDPRLPFPGRRAVHPALHLAPALALRRPLLSHRRRRPLCAVAVQYGMRLLVDAMTAGRRTATRSGARFGLFVGLIAP